MRLLLNLIDRLSLAAAWFGGFLLLAMTVLIIAEIFVRWLGDSLSFAWEYAVYSMGVAMFLGLGHAQRSGAHIRVSLVSFLLPQRAQRTSELMCTAVAIAISAFAAYALLGLSLTSFQSNTRSFTTSQVPLAIPQFGFALGLFLLTLQFIARGIRLLRGESTERDQHPISA